MISKNEKHVDYEYGRLTQFLKKKPNYIFS